MRQILKDAVSAALDLLFPESCVSCGRAGSLLCDRCAQAVPPLPRPVCARCGQPGVTAALCSRCRHEVDAPITMARAAALHDEPMRTVIHALKYGDRPGLAPLLSRYLVAAIDLPEWQDWLPILTAVCPVPLHPARLAWRGYNQSALLAEHLCHVLGLPFRGDWIVRHRDTPPQVGLTARERSTNVAASFTADPRSAGAGILLIDDVYTTGATLQECARAARSAGALHVCALTLARPLLAPVDSVPTN